MRSTAFIVSLALSATSAYAQTPPPPPAPEPLTFHAFASVSSLYSFNKPPSKLNNFRVFDYADERLDLDVVELSLDKPATRPRMLGFRIDFEAGQRIPKVEAASGLFRDPDTGVAKNVDLQQAFASIMLGHGVRIDGGKFVTPLGLEVIEGWDGYNDNASRGVLFGYAIPFTHTGARVSFTGRRVSGLVMVVNGWDNFKDNNSGKTIGGQITFAPVEGLSVLIGGITGPEQRSNNHDLRSVLDVVATYKINDRSTIGFNGDIGHENGTAIGGGVESWRTVAGYARLGLTSIFAVCLRAEMFNDVNGGRTGVVQRLREFTLTPEFRASSHVVVRGDFRIDRSNQPVFDAREGAKKTQRTLQFNLLLVL